MFNIGQAQLPGKSDVVPFESILHPAVSLASYQFPRLALAVSSNVSPIWRPTGTKFATCGKDKEMSLADEEVMRVRWGQ